MGDDNCIFSLKFMRVLVILQKFIYQKIPYNIGISLYKARNELNLTKYKNYIFSLHTYSLAPFLSLKKKKKMHTLLHYRCSMWLTVVDLRWFFSTNGTRRVAKK